MHLSYGFYHLITHSDIFLLERDYLVTREATARHPFWTLSRTFKLQDSLGRKGLQWVPYISSNPERLGPLGITTTRMATDLEELGQSLRGF